MGSFLRPVGPQSPSVYWRRRIIVFGIPLVLIAFLAYSCSGSGGSGQSPTARSSAGATSTSTSAIITPGATPTGSLPPIESYPVTGPTGTSTATSGATSGSGGSGGGSTGGTTLVGSTGCTLSVVVQLDKTSTTGLPTYPSGQNPVFNVVIKNSGSANCLFDVSGKGVVITVTQAGASSPAWSSATCAGTKDPRVLGPGDGYTDQVKWARVLSQASCPTNPPTVPASQYAVTASVGGVSAASVQFVLQ